MQNLQMSSRQIKEKIQELELRWWQLEDRMDLMKEHHSNVREIPEVKEMEERQKRIENDIYLIIDTVGADEYIKTSIPTLMF